MTLTQEPDVLLDPTKRLENEKAAVQRTYDMARDILRRGSCNPEFWAQKVKALEFRLWELGTMH